MHRFVLGVALLFLTCQGFGQNLAPAGTLPDYIRLGTIPDFVTYKAPDSTLFTPKDIHKNKPTLLMIFSPECSHCQHATAELLKDIRHFRNTQIIMVTWLPYKEMMAFYRDYKIADHPEITMTWDPKFFFIPYYHVRMYPTMVVYDKEGKYVQSFSGEIQLSDVWKAIGSK